MEGNHLKALGKTDTEIRVANYMVLWGGKDLYDEYFTPQTEFESNYTKTGMLYVDWEHGLDYTDQESPQRDDILGYVDWKTAKKDDKGLWVERVLSRRNEYMQFIEALIDEGLVGTSSEAVGKGVRKTKGGEIQIWPLKRDALTVTPAEPRMMSENAITAIKALSDIQPHLKALLQDVGNVTTGDGDRTESGKSTIEIPKGKIGGTHKMTDNIVLSDEQFQALLDHKSAPTIEDHQDEEIKALTEKMEAMLELIQNSPKMKDAGYVSPDSEDKDRTEQKSFGDYLVAVRQNNVKRLNTVYKAAMNEDVGAQGGYGVPTEYGEVLLEQSREFNALRRAGAPTITLSGRSKEYPVLDIETAPTAGDTAFAAGVVVNWTEEAATITETEPRLRLIELIAHKLAAYSLASSEIRDDFQESLDGLLARQFAKAIGSSEEYAFFRGDGNGKPLGILNSGAKISGTRSAASTIALADIAQMMSDFLPWSAGSGAWFLSWTAIDQIIQIVSSPVSWLTDARGGMPMQLLGKPMYFVGCLPALNTNGDILLVDPNYYLIADHKSGLRIAFSEHYRFVNDQLAWRVTKRVDGQPLINNALTLEDGSTTVSPFVAMNAG